MRKIPGNVPNQDMLTENLHKPLTSVPDPFGEFDSFGDHNNAYAKSSDRSLGNALAAQCGDLA
jgi:lysyl-tRNA synthetase class I